MVQPEPRPRKRVQFAEGQLDTAHHADDDDGEVLRVQLELDE